LLTRVPDNHDPYLNTQFEEAQQMQRVCLKVRERHVSIKKRGKAEKTEGWGITKSGAEVFLWH